ncbi:MAG: aromatic ring-hydroxylating dioxygenase subunit alpha [Pseudomonadota bacterium]
MNNLFTHYHEMSKDPLGKAHCLPFPVYHDPSVFHFEEERIFRRDWFFVCTSQELENPGDYFAFCISGEQIAVIRGQDQQLRAMSNNCRHRGTPLLNAGFGNTAKLIVCPYHAWSYDLEGSLKGVPFAKEDRLDKSRHCLPNFDCEEVFGLVFVKIDGNDSSMRDRLADLKDYLEIYDTNRFTRALPGTLERWKANWKLAMENAMESYHLFKVHKTTLETVTPSKLAYYVAGSSEWTLTGGKMEDHSSTFGKWLRGHYPEVFDHYLLISLPPNFVGILTHDSLGWLSVMPINAVETEIRSGVLCEPESGSETSESEAFTDAFFEEDKTICERVQAGMQSRSTTGGQLVEMERVVVDFHQYLASRLFEEAPSEHYENSKQTPFNNQA